MMKKRLSSQSGNVFTILLAAVGLAGLLGSATYSLLSGPVSTLSRTSTRGISDANLMSAARIAIMHATSQTAGGDCDSDGFIEPIPFDTASNAPSGGGLLPASVGAPGKDAWGTPIGYCVWDIGTTGACAGGTNRRAGTPNPLAGLTESQTVIAVISAGPDRKFNTTCANYTNATTPVVTSGSSDDIVHSYAYSAAAAATSSLWRVSGTDAYKAELSAGKNAKVGDDILLDATSGAANFTAVVAQGRVAAPYGAILGNSTSATSCNSSADAGIIRYNNSGATPFIEFCDGISWQPASGGSGGEDDEEETNVRQGIWARNSDDIYYSNGAVLAGSNIVSPSAVLKTAGAAKGIGISNISNCGANCGATMNIISSQGGNEANPQHVFGGSFMGLLQLGGSVGGIDWMGYGDGKYVRAAGIDTSTEGWSGINYLGTDLNFSVQNAFGFTSTALSVTDTRQVIAGNLFGSLYGTFGYSLGIPTSSVFTQNKFLVAQGQDPVAGSFTDHATPRIVSATATQRETYTGTAFNSSFDVTPVTNQTIVVVVGCFNSSANCTASVAHSGSGGTSGWTSHSSTAARARSYIYYKPLSSVTLPLTVNVSAGANNTQLFWTAYLLEGVATGDSTNRRQGANTNKTANLQVSVSGTTVPNSIAFAGSLLVPGSTPTYAAHLSNSDWIQSQRLNTNTGSFSSAHKVIGAPVTSLAHRWKNNAMTAADSYGANVIIAFPPGDFSIFGTNYIGPTVANTVNVATYNASATVESEVTLQRRRANGDPLAHNDGAGSLSFQGYDLDSAENVARITGVVNTTSGGAVSTSNMPIDLAFSTRSPDGSFTEKMRFDSRGFLGVGKVPQTRLDIDGGFLVFGSAPQDWPQLTMTTPCGGRAIMFNHYRGGFAGGKHGCGSDKNWATTAGSWSAQAGFAYGDTVSPAGGISIGQNIHGSLTEGNVRIGNTLGNDVYGSSNAVMIGRNIQRSVTAAPVQNVAIGHNATVISPKATILGANINIPQAADATFSTFLGRNLSASTGSIKHNFVVGLNTSDIVTTLPAGDNRFLVVDGRWGIGTVAPGHSLDVVGTAVDDNSTTWANASDLRLKTIGGPYARGMDEISRLHPVRFNYKQGNPMGYDSARENIGFIAQEVQPLFPEAVHKGDRGYLQFNMHSISVAMVGAIKELDASNRALEETNERLRRENAGIAAHLAQAERRLARLEADSGLAARLTARLPWSGSLWLVPFGLAAAGAFALTRRTKGGQR